jgi:tetratricopeptide (TPR) repeat protein
MARFAGFLIVLSAAMMAGCQTGGAPAVDIDRHKAIAGELRDNKLFDAAVTEYQQVLEQPGLSAADRGTLNYLIARIYYEDLQDYKKAAAYYIRARSLDPEGSYIDEANRKLVASLEKMGQVVDATRQLRQATDLDAKPGTTGDVVVARVGNEDIYMSEVERYMQSLPTDIQKQLSSPEARKKFVRQYAAMELMYRAALREGYDQDPDILEQRRLLMRQAIIDKYVADKVMPEISVDSMDIRNFYAANKDTRYDGEPLDSVRAQVFMDYQTEKAEAAFGKYIDKLAQAERLEILDQNIR